jgi:membrane protein YqaA with SNARE-associated domain
MIDLLLLFGFSFLAATILPFQSEITLAYLVQDGMHAPLLLLAVATAGNVLGAVVNWLLGRYLVHFQDRKWFPIKGKSLEKATNMYNKYGVWTLLLAWAPFIGDPLTFVAGLFRTHILTFLILVTIGKSVRYILVLLAAL